MAEVTEVTIRFALQLAEHNNKLIEGIERTLEQLRRIPVADRPQFVVGQILYWEHAIASLNWSTHIAKQRAKLNE